MQLVNLEATPFEENPLPTTGKVAGELNKRLMQHIQEAGKVPWQKPH